VLDLHSLVPATAKVALVTWLRYLRWLAAAHGGESPWPERINAIVVTGVISAKENQTCTEIVRYLRWLAASHGGESSWPEQRNVIAVVASMASKCSSRYHC